MHISELKPGMHVTDYVDYEFVVEDVSELMTDEYGEYYQVSTQCGNNVFYYKDHWDKFKDMSLKENKMAETQETAVAFVTRKVLVTFSHEVGILINDSAAFIRTAIAEYQEDPNKEENRYYREVLPHQFTVVALSDGRKLTKSLQLRVAAHVVVSIVELD
jgi:hypothetical protein